MVREGFGNKEAFIFNATLLGNGYGDSPKRRTLYGKSTFPHKLGLLGLGVSYLYMVSESGPFLFELLVHAPVGPGVKANLERMNHLSRDIMLALQLLTVAFSLFNISWVLPRAVEETIGSCRGLARRKYH
ncbi:hypothetical protein HAX54_052790, partial [Datura stramonium]|nr:hypothetical protein [Datura stramonium]